MKKPKPDRVATAFASAASLAEYHVVVDDRPRRLRYAFPDAHGVGIPTGMTQGSVAAWAFEDIKAHKWPGVMRAMLLAELGLMKEAA